MEHDQATLNDPATEPTMDETLQATLDSIKSRDTEAAAELAGNAEEAAPAKTRGPDGKFAKSEGKTGSSESGSDTVQPDVSKQPGAGESESAIQADSTAAAQGSAAAPSSWTAAGKAEWAKLSPTAQQEVLKREADFHKGVEQYREAATYGQSMQRAIAPYEATIRQYGITPDKAIQELFQTDAALRTGSHEQRLGYLHQLAKHYQIDLSQPAPQYDPNMMRLQQELQAKDQQLQQLTHSQQQREQAELNSQIEQARQGKEHFDSVRNEMAALLQAGTAKDLNEAYDMAVWARPDLRQSLVAKQLEARRAEEAKIAAQAKAAAAANVPRRGTLPASRPVGSMDDTIKATLDAIRSR